ncbi:MAG TPA: Uma2 family endonuclease [Pirellulaceae bacterium]|nr:Uma2 family endonuclease [Pirellulaceae bacterium]HMO93739.1 Uma2 family endonuclease [Pirellulaceae bacterium]HMP69925.1 Uma2 family endonuclease [Pirellulaceae bacterium]
MSSIDEPTTKLGYKEYCLFPDNGYRHEIINGRHFMNPAPSPDHQSVSKYLAHYLFSQIELTLLGKVFYAPIDVQLGDYDIVQPDLVVILNDGAARITKVKIVGAPDLLIEILSPSTRKNDFTLKRQLYEQAGVREYWIVDAPKHEVTQLVLINGRYRKQLVDGDELVFNILPAVKIPLPKIWNI